MLNKDWGCTDKECLSVITEKARFFARNHKALDTVTRYYYGIKKSGLEWTAKINELWRLN